MTTTLTVTLPNENNPPDTLRQKLRAHYVQKRSKRSPTFVRFLFLYQTCTQLYVALSYLMPINYAGYDPWTIYNLKVLACFSFYNMVANWLCLIAYKPFIEDITDRMFASRQLFENPPESFIPHLYNAENGRTLITDKYTSDEGPLSWKRCKYCNVDAPPRSHHCATCHKCVLKRDHHCYLTGLCVGFQNQRYFVVMCFYGALISTWSIYEYVYYLKNGPLSEQFTWSDFIAPIAIWKTLVLSMPLHILVIVGHLYILAFICPVSALYFLMQLCLIATNKTPHEFLKKVPVRSTSSISRNFRSVFGDFWLLNFIFPAQILFRQTDDGGNWDGLKPVQNYRVTLKHTSHV